VELDILLVKMEFVFLEYNAQKDNIRIQVEFVILETNPTVFYMIHQQVIVLDALRITDLMTNLFVFRFLIFSRISHALKALQKLNGTRS
jgi:hypothetical protein